MPSPSPSRPSVVIIGCGFAGAALAIHLLDGAAAPLGITVIERRPVLGRGVAYGTTDPAHLVNGPSSMFSLREEDPDDFTRWTLAQSERTGWQPPADAGDGFAPRWVFGTYVGDRLAGAIEAARGRVAFRHLRAEARGLSAEPGGIRVATDAGSIRADVAVLATGVFDLASLAPDLEGHPALARGPWDFPRLDGLASRNGDLLLIGTSLSMVDAVASLEARGFRGTYRAISRHGHLIEPRRERAVLEDFLGEGPLPRTTRALLARVIAARRKLLASGQDWQSLPAAIRPHVPALWAGASDDERRRFIRHLRALWDVSLHVAAPGSYGAVETARCEGRFTAGAARILSVAPEGDRIRVTLRRRGHSHPETQVFDGVVDCRGHQQHDWTRVEAPLVRQLLASGLVRPHPTGFGIEATADGRVVGPVQERLSAIGHPLRGAAWESSSIPEQRGQATALAARLLEELGVARARAAE